MLRLDLGKYNQVVIIDSGSSLFLGLRGQKGGGGPLLMFKLAAFIIQFDLILAYQLNRFQILF